MNTTDLMTILHIATDPQSRASEDRMNYGGLSFNKSDGNAAYGAEVASLMIRNNGTITWDMHDQLVGKGVHPNIYHYMAAVVHAEGASLRDQVMAGNEYAQCMRSGTNTLVKWMDVHFNIPLFRLTMPDAGGRKGSGNNVTCITIYPDLIINEETGTTALEIQISRDTKATRGQAAAAYRRGARLVGTEKTKQMLSEAIEDAEEKVKEELPRQKRPLLMSDDETDEE